MSLHRQQSNGELSRRPRAEQSLGPAYTSEEDLVILFSRRNAGHDAGEVGIGFNGNYARPDVAITLS